MKDRDHSPLYCHFSLSWNKNPSTAAAWRLRLIGVNGIAKGHTRTSCMYVRSMWLCEKFICLYWLKICLECNISNLLHMIPIPVCLALGLWGRAGVAWHSVYHWHLPGYLVLNWVQIILPNIFVYNKENGMSHKLSIFLKMADKLLSVSVSLKFKVE